jgi:hypothetical protein
VDRLKKKSGGGGFGGVRERDEDFILLLFNKRYVYLGIYLHI